MDACRGKCQRRESNDRGDRNVMMGSLRTIIAPLFARQKQVKHSGDRQQEDVECSSRRADVLGPLAYLSA